MDSEKIKRMLDACYMAKRIRELLPKLPDGVSPAYIQYLDVIHTLQKTKEYVMEEKGYLKKISSDEDGRVTYIAITKSGEELSDKYDRNYYSRLAPYLDMISDEEADCMIQTIKKFYQVMSERRVDIE